MMAPPKHNFKEDQSLAQETTPDEPGYFAKLLSNGEAFATYVLNGGGDAGTRAAIAGMPLKMAQQAMAMGIKDLWAPMLHPPISYRGGDFQYRSADGSNNSILYPELGKAGLPYAKSVPSKAGIHGARPDPGDLFDLLMARKDDKQSNSGISSMLLYHASVIIHDIFRTNAHDKDISDTSSYLDLSPLYGYDQATQDTVRQKQEGLLKPDTFADKRLLLQPPGVCIYLIMYNRFHNYVAQQLLSINANGKFSIPGMEDQEAWKKLSDEDRKAMLAKQDEDLFQTARLITCGLYINISIHDYLRVLLSLHGKDTAFTLDPRIEIPLSKEKTGGKKDSRAEGTTRATGNMVSVEFNLLYRFHSAISIRDRVWSENFFKLFLKQYLGKNVTEEQIINGEVDVPMFKRIIDDGNGYSTTPEQKDQQHEKEVASSYLPEGLEITGFDGKNHIYKFKRNAETHMFDDAELAAEMAQVIEDPICQFGAQNIPKIFKAIEILGILQARKWEVATLNEFREFFGLERHKKFEDINSDPEITDALCNLYEHPDMVELYPGLLCEGQGRCLDPGINGPNNRPTALWSGVFCDAVTLVRSDRFYTVDWNVASLTAWGMREVTSDPKVLKGSVFHRLFQRAFPGYFKYNSLHLWQPFITPAKNIIIAREQNYLKYLSPTGLEWPDLVTKLSGVKNPEDPKFSWDLFSKLKYEDLEGKIYRTVDRTPSTPVIETPYTLPVISNYEMVKNILNHPSFQNPGVLDTQMIPGQPLQDAMSGKNRIEAVAEAFEDVLLNTKDSKSHILRYFDGMAEEITEREQRSFQKLKLDSTYFDAQKDMLQKLNLEPTLEEEEMKKISHIQKLSFKETSKLSADEKEQLRKVQQTYQLDIVKDYAIPIVTRFFVDFLGFWDHVKSVAYPERAFDENQIHTHIRNCQDYIAYHSDETTQWQRRVAFGESLTFLKEQTEYGVKQNAGGRKPKTDSDKDYVVKIRQLGIDVSKELKKTFKTQPEIAAVMLKAAMDVAQRSVLTFTRVLSFYINDAPEVDPHRKEWIDIQNCAFSSSAAAMLKLERYVLEAQRLSVQQLVIRKFQPDKPEQSILVKLSNTSNETITLKSGDKVLLDLYTAQQDPKIFPRPETFGLFPSERKLDDYLSYGKPSSDDDTFRIQGLTLLGLTGMLKYVARFKDLRVAHDTLGRLKQVKTPLGAQGFMTITWDQVVPYPTTWNVRYNGEGRGVYFGKDNANQGHGSSQVYQKPFLATYERNLAKMKNLEDRIQNLEKERKKLVAVLNGDL